MLLPILGYNHLTSITSSQDIYHDQPHLTVRSSLPRYSRRSARYNPQQASADSSVGGRNGGHAHYLPRVSDISLTTLLSFRSTTGQVCSYRK